MHCFAQLNSRDLPSGVHPFGDGVFQLFYCVGEQCSPWDPFAPGHVRRVIRTGLDRLVLTTRPGGDEFPAKQITGWTPQPDYPSIEEIKDLISPKRELTDEEFNALCDGPVYYPLAGEKLMGWPHWVQSVEYPACPQCATRMEAFLQVDSEKNVPFMFGDCGSGHVCVCPSHRDVLSFCWACS